MKAPKRDRPHLPKGYIKTDPKGLLSWTAVEKQLRTAPYFWIATTNDDGRPHLVQTWAVWVDQQLWFEGSERTIWARNLARDPRASFGLQIGHNVGYGDGTAEIVPRNFIASPIERGALEDTQPGIVLVRDGQFTELVPKPELDLSTMPESWRTLPVAQAEELLVEPARKLGGEVTYEHDTDKAIAAATGGATSVLLRPVDAQTLKKVADSWERLPQKTTYFYPKAPAGLVLRPLGD